MQVQKLMSKRYTICAPAEPVLLHSLDSKGSLSFNLLNQVLYYLNPFLLSLNLNE